MKKLLVIVGPTGTGKTALGLKLAEKFNGELVSADSRQIYIGMDVGTGKESQSSEITLRNVAFANAKVRIQKGKGFWEINGVKIHLYDLIHPDEAFSVAAFQQGAYSAIEQITLEGKLPILVGGTGLYIQAVTEGLKIPKVPPDQKLRSSLEKKTTETLLARLQQVDPVSFERIDKANRRRIIRALEVYEQTGEAFSSLKQKFNVDLDILMLGLTADRGILYQKVDRRVASWYRSGEFQKEAEKLKGTYPPTLPAFTSLGYQDVFGLLDGKFSKEEAIQRTSFKHHGYIRAQLTWFRRTQGVLWLDVEQLDIQQIQDQIKSWLKKEEV